MTVPKSSLYWEREGFSRISLSRMQEQDAYESKRTFSGVIYPTASKTYMLTQLCCFVKSIFSNKILCVTKGDK